MCVDMGVHTFGKGGFTGGSRKGGFTGGSQRGSREPCEPPPGYGPV